MGRGTAIAGQSEARYHKRDFWADENLKYAEPHFRMRKVAREVRRIARGSECDLLDVGCGMTIHVCLGNTQAELLKWRERDGALSGTFEYVWMSGHSPSEAYNSVSSGLSGTLTGTAITLNLGFSHPLRGKLDGGQFSLNIPQPHGTTKTLICQPASMADWNNATAAIVNQVNQDNNRPASQAGG